MKLMNVIPVTGNILTEDMITYIRKYLGQDTSLETTQIKSGPSTIECEYDEALAAPEVIKLCMKAEEDGYDGIFINCFGDPGVRAARECVNIPVFGGFEPAMHLALGLADNIAIVTVMDNVLPLISGGISKARLNGRVTSLRSVDIPVEDLQNHDKLLEALTHESISAISDNHAEAIVLGCTAMVDVAENLQKRLLAEGYDIPVMEAAQSAVMLLELYAKMHLKQSRITYMQPPIKA